MSSAPPNSRVYNSPGGNVVNGVIYLYDANVVVTNTNDNSVLSTGAYRAAQASDFAANISVSGLSISVGAVTLTGTNPVTVINTPNVIPLGGYLGITGTPTVSISNNPTVTVGNPILAVSGNFAQNTPLQAVSGLVTLVGTSNVNITNGILPVSGSLTATIGNIAVTGGSISISNPVLAVSGAFAATIGNVAVTGGSININGTPTVTVGNAVVAVSGVVSTSVTVGNVAVTGTVTTLSLMELVLLSGISGVLSSNISAPAYTTGTTNATIIGTPTVTVGNSYLNVAVTGGSIQTIITGSVATSVSNPIGVTGVRTDLATTYTGFTNGPYTMLPVGGRAVAVSGAGLPSTYNTGDYAMLSFNQANGGLLVNQGTLDQTQDNVTTWIASTGTAAVASTSGINNGGFGTPLLSNPQRRAAYIQNTSTGVLLIAFSASIPTTGSFNVLLKGGVAAFDGNGQSWLDAPAIYTGPISVTGYGSSPSYVAWQL